MDIFGIGAAVDKVVTEVAGIAVKLAGDPKAQAAAQVAQAEQAALASLAQSSAATAAADDKAESWLTRSMRPLSVLWALAAITIIAALGAFGRADALVAALRMVPPELWTLVTAGTGIYFAGRSTEKVATTIVKAIKK